MFAINDDDRRSLVLIRAHDPVLALFVELQLRTRGPFCVVSCPIVGDGDIEVLVLGMYPLCSDQLYGTSASVEAFKGMVVAHCKSRTKFQSANLAIVDALFTAPSRANCYLASDPPRTRKGQVRVRARATLCLSPAFNGSLRNSVSLSCFNGSLSKNFSPTLTPLCERAGRSSSSTSVPRFPSPSQHRWLAWCPR